MENTSKTSLAKHLSSLEDPRIRLKVRDNFIDIIIITICAVICGADDWVDVADYGRAKRDWLKSFLKLPKGIPSHDTFGRVFSLLCPEQLEKCFVSWIHTVCEITDGQTVAIDGKTLRRSYDRSSNKVAIHMMSAWAAKKGSPWAN